MMSRLKLKRAVSSTADVPVKKTRMPAPVFLETPHPTLESSALTYKLPSSLGKYETPRDFSPVPISSSQRLKENRAKPPKRTYGKYGKPSKKTVLESPFGSLSSPEKEREQGNGRASGLFVGSLPDNTAPLALGGPLSSLPLPLASAPSSPNRRAQNTHIEFDLFSPARNVDFNRPPSQLSLYDYNACAFDADLPALFQSTPRNSTTGYDTESDDEDMKLGSFANFRGGYETPDMGDDSDWTSDSLISPPRKDQDVDMLPPPSPQVLENLFDSLILMPSSPLRTRSLDSALKDKDSILDTTDECDTSFLAPALPITRTRSGTVTGRARSGTIKSGAGATIVLGTGVRAPPTRTRSGTVVQGVSLPPGRTRSGSIVAAGAGPPGRARSGSIVAPTGRVRSGSIIAPPPALVAPAMGRVRSGSIIAPPGRARSASVVGRTRSGSVTAVPIAIPGRARNSGRMPELDEDSPDELDILAQEPKMVSSVKGKAKKLKGRMKRSMQDEPSDEEIDDDELLLMAWSV